MLAVQSAPFNLNEGPQSSKSTHWLHSLTFNHVSQNDLSVFSLASSLQPHSGVSLLLKGFRVESLRHPVPSGLSSLWWYRHQWMTACEQPLVDLEDHTSTIGCSITCYIFVSSEVQKRGLRGTNVRRAHDDSVQTTVTTSELQTNIINTWVDLGVCYFSLCSAPLFASLFNSSAFTEPWAILR